ncbi:DUF4956 domain-containing protein [Oerskovia enterophila]|uniref:DUF4956 domain-containing protein n=1 Tax=Oerskovia enterophila TaxID=43678 RepID=A0ABX2Y621_9CELL|nr:DUF4956 domain-containing protein [Oerskovia enterophila]OCI31521.1 hypothetical protein OERS_17950 [Oerskovia enterophila]
MTQPPQLALYLVDLVAVLVLTFGLYFPRHRRRDLVVAYLGVNVGVLAVAATLASSTVGAGLGLGLFGVLSIIRLRSTELSQHEVAYYFAALALGLLGGLGTSAGLLGVAGSALILVVMAVADHPRLLRRHRSQVIMLDRAFPDEVGLVAYLEQLLGAHVHSASVQRLDLVNDTTLVDVRYEVAPGGGVIASSGATPSAAALPGGASAGQVPA